MIFEGSIWLNVFINVAKQRVNFVTSEIFQRVLDPDLCTAHILLQNILQISIKANNMPRKNTQVSDDLSVCILNLLPVVSILPRLVAMSLVKAEI